METDCKNIYGHDEIQSLEELILNHSFFTSKEKAKEIVTIQFDN